MSTTVDALGASIQKTINLLNDVCVEFDGPEKRLLWYADCST
jgi:hypothetical protein